MKVVFIYPAIEDTGFNTAGDPALFSRIHHGLCYLSAACKKNGFDDVSLLDLRAMRGWEDFREKIKNINPEVAAVTTMSPDFKYAVKCVEIVKEVNPRVKVVAGGIHPTVCTGDLVGNDKVDYVITGEGEAVFPELLRELKYGKKVERLIKGRRLDVNEIPFIDRELFDCLELPYDFFLPLPSVTILSGRGCSYACKFCSPVGKLVHGPHIRRRNVDNVMAELEHLRGTYGFRSISFVDDCFTEDRSWVMDFCRRYKKSGFRQPFVCQMRADIICNNTDMMKELKNSGLAMAFIGFESGSDRMLKFANKGATLAQNLEAARICRRLGIKVWAFLMFGMPTETNREAQRTLRMARRIKPYRASPAFFTPHPGSIFYDYCKKRDLALIDDYDDFVDFPEVDKPKIKNIDYDFLRKMVALSKKVSFKTAVQIKIEKAVFHRINKPFKSNFQEEAKANPTLNKMSLLRLAHAAGRL